MIVEGLLSWCWPLYSKDPLVSPSSFGVRTVYFCKSSSFSLQDRSLSAVWTIQFYFLVKRWKSFTGRLELYLHPKTRLLDYQTARFSSSRRTERHNRHLDATVHLISSFIGGQSVYWKASFWSGNHKRPDVEL